MERAEATSPGSVLDPFSATIRSPALFGAWFPELILNKRPGCGGGQGLECDFRGDSSSNGSERQARRPRVGEGAARQQGPRGRGKPKGGAEPRALNPEIPVMISQCCHRGRCFRHTVSCPPARVGNDLYLQGTGEAQVVRASGARGGTELRGDL